ncbi:MAG: hypothetical protein O3B91_02565 [Actinomycetota bacterium]|nr:hypothetical protein [Actinomycetota bacterium]MDA3019499.1 hypothetical protein [Actinomycetota bacterium]
MILVRLASTMGVDTTSVSDAGSTRVVWIVTLLLIAIGIGLGVLNVWFWRKTKPDPEALGPLVEMSSRKFAALDLIEQRHRLDQLRPSLMSSPSVEPLPVMQAPIILDEEPQEIDDEVIEDLVIDEEVDQVVSRIEDPLLSTSVNDIDWDDDEWPDVDDWSSPVDRLKKDEPVLMHELFDQDQDSDQKIDDEVVAEDPKERPAKGPVSIDPLLGF